ncbi:DNA-3-methyladenine glycosylase [Phytohabitans houttuyneae]|uniref:Putative 3-methyladenine DNA glycosylase n=1 Tax=Phytohabitans houttuyneae TaxID=1076126 RepID=A0A6V8JZ09_9ACTN|nr:DNA-3-methyladenine glycosylase [Phytohabitans houttuyneae]GFJ76540.1 putative 3-methyladenine DNA glycosylase [Phytohabitans houttuyneae]
MGDRARRTPLSALRDLLAGPVLPAARGLLGCELSAGGVTVRITEVEAYAGTAGDPASHAHRARTPRNAVMFGPAGHLYVYFTYGMHWCANVVTGIEGEASAVLLRAGSVVAGSDVAAERRRSTVARDLARGPARLCQALGIDGTAYGVDLLAPSSPVRLSPPTAPVPESQVAAGPRVGVTGAHDREWRFWIADDPTVSAYRRHVPRKRPQ